MDDNTYVEQLYPKQSDKQSLWKEIGNYKKSNSLRPTKIDAERLYKMISKLSGGKESRLFDKTNDKITRLMNEILSSNIQKEGVNWTKHVKFDLVKGSIYKIKKYFLENNNIKDIRGGSAIIDYVNNNLIKEEFENNKELEKYDLNESNIIYSGGGNIVIAVPEGAGRIVSQELEGAIEDVALTVMNAFEYITVTLYDFAFDYKNISRELNTKLEERKKLKLYEINPKSDLKYLKLEGSEINLMNNLTQLGKENRPVCSLCDIRDAEYVTEENGETLYMCQSCARKHKVGQEVRNRFLEEFSNRKDIKPSKEVTVSLDKFKNGMAVIYGDGNNLGNIVMNITNPFEMMYFSRILDNVTKDAVYDSIYEVMKEESKFEIIALGGDDIFIIVPAEYAIDVTSSIIEKFNTAFGNSITMSASIVYSKPDTPVSSVFDIAQKRLKAAKHYLRKNSIQNDGTIDIVEVVNGIHIDVIKDRLFPISNKNLKALREKVKEYKTHNNSLSSIYNINYAQKNMQEQEFNLFYFYNASKSGKSINVDDLIKSLYGEQSEQRKNPYKIYWDDLLLIWKRG